MSITGSLIALAWPETRVTPEGKWYDMPMRWLGFINNEYYTAGHAAFVLANHETKEFKYFDFGRYHTPAKTGRVRSSETDPELRISTKVEIRDGKVTNIDSLMAALQSNTACHGDGVLLASIYNGIEFEQALHKAEEMQERGAIDYGPFVYNGTNCSRFVSQVARHATKSISRKLLLHVPYTISATPKFNVRMLNSSGTIYRMEKENIPVMSELKLI